MDTQNSKSRGRPAKVVTWPEGSFKLNDIKIDGITRTCLQMKANQAVDAGILKIVGTEKLQMGRPRNIFCKVAQASQTS